MKMKLFVSVLLLLAISICPLLASEGYLIVPGKSIGKVVIGDDFGAVQPTLGVADFTREVEGSTLYTFKMWQMVIAVSNDRSIIQNVLTSDPRFHLANGIKCGSSSKNILKALGEPTRKNGNDVNGQWYYTSKGLVIQIASSRAIAIGVMPKSK